MPERKSMRRVDSTDVQGEGSFVVLRRIPYGVISEAGRKLSRGDVTAEDNDAFVRNLIERSVVEWNWVDDAGKPLPLPADATLLYDNEVNFLLKHITGGETKN